MAHVASADTAGAERKRPVPRLWAGIILSVGVAAFFPISAMESGWDASLWSAAVIVAGVFLLHTVAHLNIWQALRRHWKSLLLWTVLYFVVGMVYTLARWELFVVEWRHNYDALHEQYVASGKQMTNPYSGNLTPISWEDYYSWKIGPKPEYTAYESQVKRWLFLWPWSFVSWVLSDLVVDCLNAIYNSIGNLLNIMANRHLQGLQQ